MAKKGLGRGLTSLLPEEPKAEENHPGDVLEIKINQIEPNRKQPRKAFDDDKIDALAQSIQEHGMIQPIVVIPSDVSGLYTIVAGERRWRAAKKAGLTAVPAVIRSYNEEQVAEIALIENLQREDLNPIEEALGYHTLLEEFHLTQERISQRIGKSRSAVANSLRLLSLEEPIKKLLIQGKITGGHARAILSLEDSKLRLVLTKRILEENLNVRQAENLAKQLQKAPRKEKEKTAYEIELESIQESLSSRLGTKVKIVHGAKKGKIEIEYYGNQDLERILGQIHQ
jgi:ParB family chromosome partitioning protein